MDFVLTGAATYQMTLTRRDGQVGLTTINGSLINPGDQNIAEFRAFDAGGNGGGDPYNFYINSLFVPEPSTLALVGLGLLGALALRRRK